MNTLKCSIHVIAGIIPNAAISKFTRVWEFTQADMDNPPTYIDGSGAAMNYAASLQNPKTVNWVKVKWIWH